MGCATAPQAMQFYFSDIIFRIFTFRIVRHARSISPAFHAIVFTNAGIPRCVIPRDAGVKRAGNTVAGDQSLELTH
jgi:hypothetical protein